MIECEVDIPTSDGVANTFISHPDEGGPHPLVIFLMDAPGKREELHDMARRIATVGYYVVLPNLYYRWTREFVVSGSEESRKTMFEHMNNLSNAMVVDDCRAVLEYADRQSEAAPGAAGAVGYCMSGPFAFAVAAQIPERIKASASIHGVRLFGDAKDSPHRDAAKIQGEMYFGCAEVDEWAPPEMVEGLDGFLAKTGIRYRIEWYPGAEHGFVFPQRAGKYHKPSAERHWERLFALFRRNLGAGHG